MSKITRNDLLITLKACIKMAQQDAKMDKHEEELLSQIMKLGKIGQGEVADFGITVQENIEELSVQLSCLKAKKFFLLAVATVALADTELAKKEIDFLKVLTEKLEIGKVKIDAITYVECRGMIFKLISDVKGNADLDLDF